jgi:NOL1/NOP2/sun family putative RNA methylase
MNLVISDELRGFLLKLIPERLDAMLEHYAKPLPEAFRVNTLKTSVERCLQLLKEDGVEPRPIPWTRHGFYAEPQGVISTSLWHLLGLVYIQGPVSMVVSETLEVEPGHRVLDLCAAPGSKSTHIAQMLEGRGLLVSNDVSRTRVKALSSNLQRCGVVNVVVTIADGRWFGNRVPDFFDRVLVDAPCSSLGIGMKDWSVLKNYNVKISQRMSRLQKSLIFSGFKALKPGGIMVYATCTLHPIENEWVVAGLLEKFANASLVDIGPLGVEHDHGLEEWDGMYFGSEMRKTVRIYPFQSGAEGFFIAKIRKEES